MQELQENKGGNIFSLPVLCLHENAHVWFYFHCYFYFTVLNRQANL